MLRNLKSMVENEKRHVLDLKQLNILSELEKKIEACIINNINILHYSNPPS